MAKHLRATGGSDRARLDIPRRPRNGRTSRALSPAVDPGSHPGNPTVATIREGPGHKAVAAAVRTREPGIDRPRSATLESACHHSRARNPGGNDRRRNRSTLEDDRIARSRWKPIAAHLPHGPSSTGPVDRNRPGGVLPPSFFIARSDETKRPFPPSNPCSRKIYRHKLYNNRVGRDVRGLTLRQVNAPPVFREGEVADMQF